MVGIKIKRDQLIQLALGRFFFVIPLLWCWDGGLVWIGNALMNFLFVIEMTKNHEGFRRRIYMPIKHVSLFLSLVVDSL